MRPRLIHPQTIVVQTKPTNLVTDAEMGEPAGRVAGASSSFQAQVAYGTPLECQRMYGVQMPDAKGYLIALNQGVAALLHKGDRIIAIGTMTVNFLILDLVPAGHYSSSTLLYIPFSEANS